MTCLVKAIGGLLVVAAPIAVVAVIFSVWQVLGEKVTP